MDQSTQNEVDNVKLLNCPFCGGKAAWGEGEQKLKYDNEQVYCSVCYAMTPPEMTKAEAAEWWNTRINSLPAIEALRDLLQRAVDAQVDDNTWRLEARDLLSTSQPTKPEGDEMNDTEIKKLATEFADDLFGSFDRLICSRKDDEEDEGRAGWSKQPIIDNLERLITSALKQENTDAK